MSSFIYTTGRVVRIQSRLLSLTHKALQAIICIYIIGYGIIWCKTYQTSSPLESVVVTKVKGAVKISATEKDLKVPNPELYQRIWDASDIVIPSQGEESGGFFILTNLVITPNQTRGVCPEDNVKVDGADCTKTNKCEKGKLLPLGNGYTTGKCVLSGNGGKTKACEVEAWCPIEKDVKPFGGVRALLEDTKEFTVLVKNSIEFPAFGPTYKRRNIMDSATEEYLKYCIYDPKSNFYCPTFRIGDIVAGAKANYAEVSKTGAVFAIRIRWWCDFDFGKGMRECRPEYSFARLDNPQALVSRGFNFLSATYHEENRRTLTRNFGLKFIIDVEGEGKKFDPVKLVLALGASMGLLALASTVCDFIFGLLCTLQKYVSWAFLSGYTPDMKYDSSYIPTAQFQIGDGKVETEMEEVQVLKSK